MNKQKKLLLLVSVLVLASAITLVVVKHEDTKEKIKNTPATILEWTEIDGVSWEYNGASYAFRKEDGIWTYPADTAFPVDGDKMNALLEQFGALGAAFTIEEVEDYGQYGLEKPICTITLTQGDGETTLTLGDYSQMDGERYASLGDGNVYLLSHDPLEEFDTDLTGLIQNDEIPDFDTLETLTVSGEKNDRFTRNEEGESLCDDDLYYRDSDGGALDTDLVNSFVRTLKSLDLTDYVTYNATEEELQSTLLDNPAQTITVAYTQEDSTETGSVTLHLSKEEDPSEDEKGQAYARVGDSPILYRISDSAYETLTACGYNDLRHQQVFSGDFAQAVEFTVSVEDKTAVFTYETRDDEKKPAWYFEDTKVDLSDVQTALENLTADEFTTTAPVDKQELSMTVKLDREGENEITISLYRQDGTQSLARVNGKSLCYLPRSQAVALIEALNAILLG